MGNVKLITENINLDGVGELEIGWDFDEDDYRDWLSENGLEHNKQSLIAYVGDSVTFEVEYFDNDTYHHMGYDYADYDDMVNNFGEELTHEIIGEIDKNGSYRIETSELYNSEEFDVNNPDELNNIAMKILNHGEYYKGCRGFILTNGVIVYTPAEHNMVSQINGIRGTFDFIKKGNIRILNQSIDLSKPPTPEQREVLRKVIASYSNEELYVDIMDGNGECGSTYVKPDWRYVMGEIDRYFSEGIRPRGNTYYEGVQKKWLNTIHHDSKNIVINETQYKRLFKEGASSILYHFLAFDEFAYMINNDCFTPSGAEGDWHNGKNTMSYYF